jgi:deoxyadenosine/deoxycytidine kinase
VSARQPVTIIEGPIGVGKSTLAKELAAALTEQSGLPTLTCMEPDETNNPFLGLFYGDKRRWSFTMQAHLLGARFRMHLEAQWHAMNGTGPAVLDRSFYGDTCFARMLNKSGDMDDNEFNTYKDLYHGMTASVLFPNVCVRILVSPEVAQQRIQKRAEEKAGRKCEEVISLDYLKALDLEITHMAACLSHGGVQVIEMPWDIDRETEEQRRLAAKSLASRILEHRPVDPFLDLHRRTI